MITVYHRHDQRIRKVTNLDQLKRGLNCPMLEMIPAYDEGVFIAKQWRRKIPKDPGEDFNLQLIFFGVKCRVCGKTEDNIFVIPVMQRLLEQRMCYECDYWSNKVCDKDCPHSVRIDNRHYQIGQEDAPKSTKGFGERPFTIQFFDGRVVTTTDLWCQGVIPQCWRQQLPNNAEFGIVEL